LARFLNILLKSLTWLFLIVLTVIVLAVYAIQLPSVQTLLAQKATKWLTEKIGAPVSIGTVRVSWFDNMTLENVNIKDLKGRDMITIPEVYIDYRTNFSFNLKEKFTFDNNLDYVMLSRPDIHLIREPDGYFNTDHWMDKIRSLSKNDQDPNAPENNVPFTIDEGEIQQGSFTISDSERARFPKEMFDYYNFTFSNISGKAKNFFVQGDTITFSGESIRAVEKRSGLEIHEIDTEFFYSRQQMLLKQLNARINNSVVRNFIGLYYDTPADFNDFNNKVRMKVNFVQTRIDAQDIGRFAPEMYDYREEYRLSGNLKGIVTNFKIDDFRLDFGKSSFFKGNVAFKGLPELSKTNWDFDLKPSVITQEDARQYAGEKYYDEHVKKVGKIDFSGKFNGLYNDFVTTANISSSQLGKVRGRVKVKLNKNAALSTYYGDIVTNELQVGQIINRPDLIKDVTFDGIMDGKGLTIPSAVLKLDGDIRQIYLNDYNYRNIALQGEMSQSLFTGLVEVYDPNLQAQVSGSIDFNDELNKFDIIGTITQGNLKELGLTKENVRLQSDLDLKVSGNTLDDWLGAATLKNIKLANESRDFKVDSLNIYSNARFGKRELVVKSDLFDVSLMGDYIPSQVIKDAVKLAKEYRLFFKADEQERTEYYASLPTDIFKSIYTLNYEVKLKDSEPFFAYFLPSVRVAEGAVFNGQFKQRSTAEVSLYGKMDSCQIGENHFYNNTIDLFASKVSASPDVLSSWVIQSKTQQLGERLFTEDFEISGAWDEANLITFDTKIKQQDNTNDAAVYGKMQILPEGLELTFNPANTRLNILGDTWRLAENNRIYIKGNDILFINVALSHEKQRVALNGIFSYSSDEIAMLTANDFNLKTIQPLIDYDIAGVLNGNVAIQEIYQSALINSDVKIDRFMFEKQFVGDISAETAWDNAIRKLQINAGISRENQEVVTVVGTYDPANEESPMNLLTEVQAFPVKLFQGFVNDVFSDLGGTATGRVTIKGKTASPNINGEININNGKLRVDVLNSYLYFTDKIIITKSSFTASEKGITLKDAAQNGNSALLEGGVYSLGNGKYQLAINATMPGNNGFQLLNTTLSDNEYFFGKAFVGGDIQLAGPFNDIDITGNLTSKRNTHLVIPLDGATTVNTEVEAIPFLNNNREIVYDLSTDLIDSVATPPKINLNGVRMAFNLTLTPAAECEIIFDRTNNDKLVTRGNGRLTLDYDTRGGFSITGPYEVESGKYDFSFQNLASLRKFDIERGSRIEWSGDPYSAQLNLKTGYITNLAINTIDPSITSSTRYPAQVSVNMTDDLMHPTISFGLAFMEQQLPIDKRPQVLAFEERLRNDEQLMSRNVSSILAFNQILFGSNESNTNVLNQQFLLDNISNLVSNQIGNIASQIDPNLELGLQLGDIRQNFNNTQLNVAYQYNDRLRLKGNSFYSNGSAENITNNQTQLTLGGEFEYLLSNDGTWLLRAYGRSVPTNLYTATATAATGNILVSGVSVQFSRNFNYIFPKRNAVPKGISTSEAKEENEISMK
jgi:hypothetical protein